MTMKLNQPWYKWELSNRLKNSERLETPTNTDPNNLKKLILLQKKKKKKEIHHEPTIWYVILAIRVSIKPSKK